MKRPLLVIATHNPDKLREIRRLLKKVPYRVLGLDDFPPPYRVRETGKTLEENALLKARKAVCQTGQSALSDDSGLEIAALGGRPGVYSARFAGFACSYEDNNRKVLRRMRGVEGARRRAVFRCVVAFVTPEGKEKLFQGRCVGRIVEEKRGREGFGYDPIFQPSGEKHTFAELSLEKKNRLSHRAIAFGRAARFLEGFSGKGAAGKSVALGTRRRKR